MKLNQQKFDKNYNNNNFVFSFVCMYFGVIETPIIASLKVVIVNVTVVILSLFYTFSYRHLNYW